MGSQCADAEFVERRVLVSNSMFVWCRHLCMFLTHTLCFAKKKNNLIDTKCILCLVTNIIYCLLEL